MGRALLTHDDFSTLPFFQAFTTLLHPPYIPYGSSALFSLPVSISFLDIPYLLLVLFFLLCIGSCLGLRSMTGDVFEPSEFGWGHGLDIRSYWFFFFQIHSYLLTIPLDACLASLS
jgi:hypothetical protein